MFPSITIPFLVPKYTVSKRKLHSPNYTAMSSTCDFQCPIWSQLSLFHKLVWLLNFLVCSKAVFSQKLIHTQVTLSAFLGFCKWHWETMLFSDVTDFERKSLSLEFCGFFSLSLVSTTEELRFFLTWIFFLQVQMSPDSVSKARFSSRRTPLVHRDRKSPTADPQGSLPLPVKSLFPAGHLSLSRAQQYPAQRVHTEAVHTFRWLLTKNPYSRCFPEFTSDLTKVFQIISYFWEAKVLTFSDNCALEFRVVSWRASTFPLWNGGPVFHIPGLLTPNFSKVFSSIQQLPHHLQAHPQIFLSVSSLTASLFTSSPIDTTMTLATFLNSPMPISIHSFSHLYLWLLLPVSISPQPQLLARLL